MFSFRMWYHWALLPPSMRVAGVVATFIVFTSGTVLFQNAVSQEDRATAPDRSVASDLTDPGVAADLSVATAEPVRQGRARSSAVVRVPRTPSPDPATAGVPFPTFARYVYAVEGSESGTALGRRDYPAEMTMSVHRNQPVDPGVPALAEDELVFDLHYSPGREEREIVAFRGDGIVFTYESISSDYGSSEPMSGTYDPAMLQIPVPLSVGARHTGTSESTDISGEVTRTEDWTVTVMRREDIEILGQMVPVWVVRVHRETRSGSDQSFSRTRTYWFDTERVLWVKWEEEHRSRQSFGLGSSTYTSAFTATLSRIEPL